MVGQFEGTTDGLPVVGPCEGPVGNNVGACEGPLGEMDGPVGRNDGHNDGLLEGFVVGSNTAVPRKAVEST